MKNILLFALALVCCMGPIIGQEKAFKSETLTIKNFDEDGKLISKDIYKNQEAASFDIPQYIADHADIGRIQIKGKFYHDSEVKLINFDNHLQEEENINGVLCESTEMSLKPFLGVSAHCAEDGKGVQIETVINDSPAHQFGIDNGDVVLSFNNKPVTSFCMLTMEIAATEIGQHVPMTIKENGQISTKDITIGAQVVHNVSYKVCPISEADLTVDKRNLIDAKVEMAVFPNPSPNLTHLNFTSSSNEAVTFYVLDLNGSVIHKNVYADFDGSLTTDFTFADHADGTYLFVIEQGGQVHRNRVIHMSN